MKIRLIHRLYSSKTYYWFLLICFFFCAYSLCAKDKKAFQAKKPFVFMENRGQIVDQENNPRKDVDYVLHSSGLSIFLSASGIHYQFSRLDSVSYPPLPTSQLADQLKETMDSSLWATIAKRLVPKRQGISYYTSYRLDMELVGANLNARHIAEDSQAYYENYYLPYLTGQDQISHIRSYKKIIYKDVYPGIDWALYTQGHVLKYDFIIHEGVDPRQIKIKYNGADSTMLQANGSLNIVTPIASLTEEKPYAYTQKDGQSVSCHWIQKNGYWQFQTASYSGGTLVIDPVIDWGSYFGGSSYDANFPKGGSIICTDNNSDIYTCGTTMSKNNIATTGAFQTELGGSMDIFLAKFTARGELLWATYLGGEEADDGGGIVVDKFNHVYVMGSTQGSLTGIATAGCWQPAFGGPFLGGGLGMGYGIGDYLLFRFDSEGQRIWGTYYGGENKEGIFFGYGIDADNAGNVYISGGTLSITNIASRGSFQEKYGGEGFTLMANDGDAFIAKFDSLGARKWGTYIGQTGTYAESGTGLKIGPSGNIYAIGIANSDSLFGTSGTFSPKFRTFPNNSLGADAFGAANYLQKFDPGGHRIWGTYFYGYSTLFQGSIPDTFSFSNPFDLYIDSAENIFITGGTLDNRGFATPGRYKDYLSDSVVMRAGSDGFLIRFDSSGNRIFSTYLGLADASGIAGSIAGIAVTGEACTDAIYIGGATDNRSGVATSNAFIPTYPNQQMGCILKLDYSSKRKYWGTYWGSTGNTGLQSYPYSELTDLFLTSKGSLLAAGNTNSIDTVSHFKGNHEGQSSVLLSAFKEVYLRDNFVSSNPVCLDLNDTGSFTLNYYASDPFNANNVFTAEIDTSIDFTNPIIIGNSHNTITGSINCSITAGMIQTRQPYYIRVTASHPYTEGSCWKNIVFIDMPHAVINVNGFVLSTAASYNSYQWLLDGKIIPGAVNRTYAVLGNGNYTVAVETKDGCRDTSDIYPVTNVTSLNDLNVMADQVKVYPNPAEDIIYIASPVPVMVLIKSVQGKLIRRITDTTSISVKDLASGLYFLQITNNEGSLIKVEKLIKNK